MSENLNVFITRDEMFMVFTEKEYYLHANAPSDVITNVNKQNMNVIASTLSAFKHVKRWRDKKKKLPNCSLYSN